MWRGSCRRRVTRRRAQTAAPRVVEARLKLLGVQLDDELLLHRRRDLATLGLAQHLGGERIVVGLQPRRNLSGQLGGVADDRLRAGAALTAMTSPSRTW